MSLTLTGITTLKETRIPEKTPTGKPEKEKSPTADSVLKQEPEQPEFPPRPEAEQRFQELAKQQDDITQHQITRDELSRLKNQLIEINQKLQSTEDLTIDEQGKLTDEINQYVETTGITNNQFLLSLTPDIVDFNTIFTQPEAITKLTEAIDQEIEYSSYALNESVIIIENLASVPDLAFDISTIDQGFDPREPIAHIRENITPEVGRTLHDLSGGKTRQLLS